MKQPIARRIMRGASLSIAVAIAACTPDTIVVDPAHNPAVLGGSAASAQPLPPAGPGQGLPMLSLPALLADFRSKAGSDTVQFGRDGYQLDEAALQVLTRQADWLRLNPMVRAKIEGHADVRLTRDHALALGERRAAAVYNFLLAQGVSPAQLTVVSWGRERPAVEGVHDAAWLQNSRVVTVLLPPEPMAPPLQPPYQPLN